MNVFAFLYVKANSKENCEDISFPSYFQMSAFLLRFKANYLEKNAQLSQFFFVGSNSRCKDLPFSHGPNLEQTPLYLVGTICNGFFFCSLRKEAGDTTVKEEIPEV